LSGTSDVALTFFLNKHNYTKALVFCLDNDRAGREAAALLARKYAQTGYHTRVELPQGKDFNEDLTALTAQHARQKRVSVRQRE
jgi:DNA primase